MWWALKKPWPFQKAPPEPVVYTRNGSYQTMFQLRLEIMTLWDELGQVQKQLQDLKEK